MVATRCGVHNATPHLVGVLGKSWKPEYIILITTNGCVGRTGVLMEVSEVSEVIVAAEFRREGRRESRHGIKGCA